VCRKCETTQLATEFHRLSRAKDGLRNDCKTCFAALDNGRSRDRSAAYRANNPDREKEYRKRYLAKAKADGRYAKVIATQQERRQAAKDAAPTVSLAAILKRDGMVCHICTKPIAERKDVDFDHVIPISRGGTHTADNIKVAHASCNRWKWNRLMSELDGQGPPAHDNWKGRISAQALANRTAAVKATYATWTPERRAAHAAKVRAGKRAKGNTGNIDNLRKGWDPEVRAKAQAMGAAAVRGTTQSPEERARRSAALKLAYAEGRRKAGPMPEETRRKISETKRKAKT